MDFEVTYTDEQPFRREVRTSRKAKVPPEGA